MNTFDLIEKLKSFKAFDEVEEKKRLETIKFVAANPDCFKRTLLIGHITGSAWVVNPDKTHVLMTHHRKSGQWRQFGGHSDGDSDTLSVAIRELEEESGLQNYKLYSKEVFGVDIHEIPKRAGEPVHKHYDIRFLFEADMSEELVRQEAESIELKWINLDNVLDYNSSNSTLRFVKKISKL